MSLEKLGLGKLLELMYAHPARVRKLLRDDIRASSKKAAGEPPSKGGDFYVPFWADAKAHAAGKSDLRKTSVARIDQNWRRQKLYPKLSAGFLRWWEEDRRYRNEPVSVVPSPTIPPLVAANIVIKIENMLAIEIEGHGPRLLYPYLRPDPALSEEAARVALWLLQQANTGMPPESLRILDVCRGRSFALEDTLLRGHEKQLLQDRLAELQAQRAALLAEGENDAAA